MRRRTSQPVNPFWVAPERLLDEYDLLGRSLGHAWPRAVAIAAGRWIFDFLSLYAGLVAVGARPSLSVALLAYCAAQLLGQIPLTPGGLGVVEARLTGTLALAAVAAAALATLAYRLASSWLPLPIGLLAWILAAAETAGRARLDGEGVASAGRSATLLDTLSGENGSTRLKLDWACGTDHGC